MIELRLCYHDALRRAPSLGGPTQTDFIIEADGRVSSASTTTGLDPVFDRCLEAVFKRMVFPRPTSGKVIVRYPVTFRPPPPPKNPPPP
ncbi:MAG: AgmX/PglI C-terminal domain-containing protein [Myxococcota bacterium]